MKMQEDTDLHRALTTMGDGAFVIDGDGRVTLWNRAAEKILGRPAREAVGRPRCEVLAGRDADGNRLCCRGCRVSTLVRMGEPVQSFDMQTRTNSGRPIWLNVSTLALANGARPPVTVHTFRDVTATKEIVGLVERRMEAQPTAPDGEIGLTRRELEVLRLMATGAGTGSLAERLHVSRATIRNHVQNIFTKLGVHSRLEAIAHATAHHFL